MLISAHKLHKLMLCIHYLFRVPAYQEMKNFLTCHFLNKGLQQFLFVSFSLRRHQEICRYKSVLYKNSISCCTSNQVFQDFLWKQKDFIRLAFPLKHEPWLFCTIKMQYVIVLINTKKKWKSELLIPAFSFTRFTPYLYGTSFF